MSQIYYHEIINCRCGGCGSEVVHHRIKQKFCSNGFTARTYHCPYCNKLRVLQEGDINCPVCRHHLIAVPQSHAARYCPSCNSADQLSGLIERQREVRHYDNLETVKIIMKDINNS